MPEIGAIGRTKSALFEYNLATDEYLDKLRWPDNIKVYEKMKRSDSQIKAMLLVLELPIRSTKWYLEPADKSTKAKKIAEFVEENLLEGLETHFDDVLRQACSMFAFGHSIFEIVYQVNKKKEITWKKFAPRPVSTIYDFIYTEVGDLDKIQQYRINNSWDIVDIPKDKLLFFSHRMENGDVRGQSVLRSAYKHWSIKDFLYKIVNVGVERNFVGTPTIQLPPNATPEDVEKAEKIAKTLRSHSMGGATIPDGFLLSMFEGKRPLSDIMPYIEHQDLMIVRSILAQFINLGSGSVGSFALSENQTDMFLMMLGAEAKYIANTFNTQAIPKIVEYNFGSDLVPRLCFKPFGGQDKIVDTLKTLVDGKVVIPDQDLETWMRERLELPEKSKDEIEEAYKVPEKKEEEVQIDNESQQMPEQQEETNIEEEKGIAKEEEKEPEETKIKKLSENNYIWSRDLTEFEKDINLADIDKDFETLEEAFLKDGQKIIKKQVGDLGEKAKKVKLEELATIPVRYKAEMTDFVFKHFKKAFETGSKQVQKELNAKEPTIDMVAIKAQAAITANNISERVKATFLSEFFNNSSLGDLEKAAKRAERAVLRG